MRLGHFSVVFWATIIFCAGVANACTYHRPGACGVDHLISDNASKFSEVGGIGLFEDRAVRSANVEISHESTFGRRGGEQTLAASNLSGQGLGSGGNGFSAAQVASSLFNREGFGEKGHDTGNLRLALTGPGLIHFIEEGHLTTIGNSTSGSAPRATPLPASWMMMLIGLALLGALAGYRKLKMTLPPDAGQAIPLA